MTGKALEILKQYYGYEQFRPLQGEIIQSILDKKDTVVLMPTGGGKSLCFQIPAMLSEGVCIVISPLLALMKDQVEALKANGISAAALNSTLTISGEDKVLSRCKNGEIKLLYISPEKLVSNLGALRTYFPVSFIAIDEAHCISAWGHDFRPEYTQLGMLREQMPGTPIIALTATADKVTRKDIVQQLRLKDPQHFIASFDRPNLSLRVKAGTKTKEKNAEILDFLETHPGEAGIIYCLSRRTTEEVAAFLRQKGHNADCYHAGLDNQTRERVQEAFINDELQIICATIAFGMGIDKSNVRWVIHYNLPKSIESFYQEIGRSGRDGLKSDTILYYSLGDLVMLSKFAAESKQSEINMARLQRMQQYAEANICRRKILLNYFGESMEHDCGNCDVCLNPRNFFDGTQLAQKALSAVIRMEEKVGVNMLIDVLRGSSRAELLEKGFQNIKTYGAGKEYSFNEWQQYILQLLHTGVMEIAYDDGFALRVTPYGHDLLYGRKKLQLARFEVKEKEPKEKKVREKKQALPEDNLFEMLRLLRLRIAREEGVPPYVVFNDASLRKMCEELPTEEEDFSNISGVGQYKMEHYGAQFLETIREFTGAQKTARQKGDTYKETLALYRQGLSVNEIAAKRELNPTTVWSHLAYLFEKGEDIRIGEHLSNEELERIIKAKRETGESNSLKALFDAMNGEIEYHKIRLGLAVIAKNIIRV
ncbi:MAG: ATP-dependent DNA helicase RecQ [Bacteroidetes bacterium]|nr:MAG: ATP-dependent DNA helicase RecQ [Bacteroidota bacterium]